MHTVVSSRLVSSRLISSGLFPPHLIPSHMISSHLIPSHPISSHFASYHLVSSELAASPRPSPHLAPPRHISSRILSLRLSLSLYSLLGGFSLGVGGRWPQAIGIRRPPGVRRAGACEGTRPCGRELRRVYTGLRPGCTGVYPWPSGRPPGDPFRCSRLG